MQTGKFTIQDVSDTAYWVAYYRAVESERGDALFSDPLASFLIGDRGERIANSLRAASKYARMNVLIRTVIIDRFIEELVRDGIDCVINLGAGLDTRPYRLNLPENLCWVEIDFPHLIAFKEEKLRAEAAKCEVLRIPLDLSDRKARRECLAGLNTRSKKAALLAEGLIVYLTETQVGELADDLFAQANFKYWITEYLHPRIYKYTLSRAGRDELKNAPFRFFPSDWFGFFAQRGWAVERMEYVPEVATQLGRRVPLPWWSEPIRPVLNWLRDERVFRSNGYMLLGRRP